MLGSYGFQRQGARPPASIVRDLPALAADSHQLQNTFIGSSSGGGPFVALVLRGKQSLVYVCDGDNLADWFGGTVDGNRIVAKSPKGTLVDATRGRSALRGSVAASGTPHAFTLKPPIGPERRALPAERSERPEARMDRPRGRQPQGNGRGQQDRAHLDQNTTTSGATSSTTTSGGTMGTPKPTASLVPLGKGIYSPVFKGTFTSCDQLKASIKHVMNVYGVANFDGCAHDKGCSAFANETFRIGNALSCVIDPFLTPS